MSSILVDKAKDSGATNEQCEQILQSELYLEHTDYVVIKIYEAMIIAPDTVDFLKNTYRDILNQRAVERAKIDSIFDNL